MLMPVYKTGDFELPPGMQVVQIFKPGPEHPLQGDDLWRATFWEGCLATLVNYLKMCDQPIDLTLVDAKEALALYPLFTAARDRSNSAYGQLERWSIGGERNIQLLDLLTYWRSCKNGELGPEWDDELITRAHKLEEQEADLKVRMEALPYMELDDDDWMEESEVGGVLEAPLRR
jgi:hypothetical protein